MLSAVWCTMYQFNGGGACAGAGVAYGGGGSAVGARIILSRASLKEEITQVGPRLVYFKHSIFLL